MRLAHLAFIALAASAGCIQVNPSTSEPPLEEPTPQIPADDFRATSGPASTRPTPFVAGNASSSPIVNSTEPESSWSLASHGWASTEAARVYPGSMVMSAQGGCTANFVFTDTNGTRVYIGTAAHCAASRRESMELQFDPCTLLDPPSGDALEGLAFFGENLTTDASESDAVGRYVYNSWWYMQANGETDGATCARNDFALIELESGYLHLANPSLESWGGPVGQYEGYLDPMADNLAMVYTVGGTRLRDTSETAVGTPFNPLYYTRPRAGVAVPAYDLYFAGKEWSFNAYFAGGCLPGDSGSPVLFEAGQAIGLMTAIDTGVGGSCEVTYLEVVLAYARQATGLDLVLHSGTVPFVPPV